MAQNLDDLYNQMNKQASAPRQSSRQQDEWDRAAAQHGLSTEEYMDKVASLVVKREKELIKEAKASEQLGADMAAGYYDTLLKVAAAHPIRDGIPEQFIKVARRVRVSLIRSMIKVSNDQRRAENILNRIDPYLQRQI